MVLLALRPEGKTFSLVASHKGIYEGSHISFRGRKYNPLEMPALEAISL